MNPDLMLLMFIAASATRWDRTRLIQRGVPGSLRHRSSSAKRAKLRRRIGR